MKYHQLKPAAQERARQWFKDSEAEMWGSDRAPDYYEDMATCLKFLGITVDMRTERWRNATTGKEGSREEYDFEWSGFWSQGDGLVFKGAWDAEHVDMTGLAEYAPVDETLRRIAIAMTAIMLAHPDGHAKITTVSNGPGLSSMHLESWSGAYEDDDGNISPELPEPHHDALQTQIAAACHWCYKQLEDNYEYDTGDEAAVEGIEANEYDFDRDGDRITCSRPRRQVVGATSCPVGVPA